MKKKKKKTEGQGLRHTIEGSHTTTLPRGPFFFGTKHRKQLKVSYL